MTVPDGRRRKGTVPEPELTPAEKRLAEEGGVLSPPTEERPTLDFRDGAPRVVDAPSSDSAPVSIDSPGAVLYAGDRAPGNLPPKDPAQAAFEESMAYNINLELWVFNSCLRSVRNMVRDVIQHEPPDSAEFNQFGQGKRTPLEQAEPYIAIEVYRNVRRSLRTEENDAEEPARPTPEKPQGEEDPTAEQDS